MRAGGRPITARFRSVLAARSYAPARGVVPREAAALLPRLPNPLDLYGRRGMVGSNHHHRRAGRGGRAVVACHRVPIAQSDLLPSSERPFL